MGASYLCEIIEKKALLPDLYSFWIQAPQITQNATPGQFIHVLCGDGVLLRRPISICEIKGDTLRFVMAVKGKGTERIAKFEVGEMLDVLGPLGRGFSLPKQEGTALLVGGGIGIFPLLELGKAIGKDVEAILGFRTKELITMQEEFESVCTKLHIATDDGSFGHHGLVTTLAEQIIHNQKVGSIFACGPMPMLKAIKELAEKYDLFCELSLEARMGCGVGACMTCVCKTSNDAYAPVCKTGPVFPASEVSFDA